MKRFSRLLLALVFATLVFGAGGSPDDPALVYNSATVAVVFDDTYTSAGVTIAGIEVEMLGTVTATWTFIPGEWTLGASGFRVPIRSRAEVMPNGPYQLRVKVTDSYGNNSEWSEVLYAKKEWRTLPKPGGCATVR